MTALTDLGRGYGYLGDALLDANKTADAETAYWKSHAIRQRVSAAFPADDRSGESLDARCQLARSWANFAALHARSRALGTARYFAQQSLDAHTKLVELDPINVEYRFDLCGRLVQVAELDILLWLRPGVSVTDRLRAEIGSNLDRAKEVLEDPAFAKDKGSRRVQSTLATVHVLRGVVYADAADTQRAWDELVKGWKLLDALCKEQPGVTVDPVHLYYKAAAGACSANWATVRTPPNGGSSASTSCGSSPRSWGRRGSTPTTSNTSGRSRFSRPTPSSRNCWTTSARRPGRRRPPREPRLQCVSAHK